MVLFCHAVLNSLDDVLSNFFTKRIAKRIIYSKRVVRKFHGNSSRKHNCLAFLTWYGLLALDLYCQSSNWFEVQSRVTFSSIYVWRIPEIFLRHYHTLCVWKSSLLYRLSSTYNWDTFCDDSSTLVFVGCSVGRFPLLYATQTSSLSAFPLPPCPQCSSS